MDINPAEYASRVIGYFRGAPDKTRIREAVEFVEMLAEVEYWPNRNLEDQWVKDVIAHIREAA